MRDLKSKSKIAGLVLIFTLGLLVTSCDTSKLQETPIENFKGIWKLEGRAMFDGIKIQIEKNQNGDWVGKVVALNDDKYVKMFTEPNDTWVSGISRSSNYEFKLTEKKIGSALFSLYGLGTTNEYKVQFIDANTIGLATGNSAPSEASIKYVRVE